MATNLGVTDVQKVVNFNELRLYCFTDAPTLAGLVPCDVHGHYMEPTWPVYGYHLRIMSYMDSIWACW